MAYSTKVNLNKLKELYFEGKSIRKIALELNVDKRTVKYWIDKLGLPKRECMSIKYEVDIEELKRLNKEGYNDVEIARKLNLTRNVVRYWRGKLGLPANSNRKRLSPEDVKIIKDLNEAGFNDREIADLLGVSSLTVRRWRKKFGLKPVGKTCCSYINLVKLPIKKEWVERCAEATRAFLAEYFRSFD
ncbi:hypothetical protein DRO97_02410 [Archaeoglobales archaeon]|nr:MAG: hypothetical protein DRO97_02410 [Archaeoglobales archaeon]